MSAEDDRAADYRAMMAARGRAIAARERAMAGDPAARRALEENWAALLDPLGDLLGDDCEAWPWET